MKNNSCIFILPILIVLALNITALGWNSCDPCLALDNEACLSITSLSGHQIVSECRNLTVPLDWPDISRSITVLIQRFKFLSSTTSHVNDEQAVQLWTMGSLLNPGQELQTCLKFLPHLADPDDGQGSLLTRSSESNTRRLSLTYSIYVMHHRGSAFSTPLTCGSASSLIDCASQVKKQSPTSYTSENAARDLLYAMSMLKDNDSKVWFYAFDYGSFLLNKAILLNKTIAEPVKIDKIVLEGVLPPDIGELVMAERNAQTAAGQLLQLCSLTDSTCEHYLHMSSSSLLDSQWRAMQLNTSQCSSLFSIESVKLALSRLLSHPTHRIALPSIFKRFSRCEASDISELQFWMALESKRNAPRLAPAIAYNILFSELLSHSRPPVSPETLRMLRDMSPLTAFPDFRFFEDFESWPTYQPTPYMSRIWGDYSGIDVLIMHGELDPIAPWAWALHTSNRLKTAKSSELVLVPNGLHMPSISSGVCVSRIIVNWLLERTTNAKSKACWEALEDLDFSSTKSTSTTSQLLFGEPQLWGQGSTVIVSPVEAQPTKDPHRRFTWHTWVLAVTWLVLVVFVLASFIVLVARGGGATHRPTGLLLAEEESRRSAGYLPVPSLDD